VDTSDARPRVLWSSVRQISITQMTKQENQYDNTNDIVLHVWRSVLLAAPGMAHLLVVGSSSSGDGCMADVSRGLMVYLVIAGIDEIADVRGGGMYSYLMGCCINRDVGT
jgi:hypothetical protein